ncbi:MAG: DNA pilot protein [Microvirus sp.]|nr:MAG: DNA pilot protein [Microvirus sp.]
MGIFSKLSSGFDWGNVASSALDATGQYFGAREINKGNIASAREQMQFQERMSGTAHQREVADLKAAGLNPALSANAGASSPIGAGYETQSGFPSLGKIPQTALALSQMKSAIKETNSRIGLNNSLKEKADVEKTERLPYAEIGKLLQLGIIGAKGSGRTILDLWGDIMDNNPDYVTSAQAKKKAMEYIKNKKKNNEYDDKKATLEWEKANELKIRQGK